MARRQIKDILQAGSNLKTRLIPDYDELRDVVDALKKTGYKIVLTQGVYDLIHEGHAKYLEAAKQLGDVLIVGVDTDALTRKRKGPNRPIVPQKERLQMLAHLRSVDVLTLRDVQHDMSYLVEVISPDIFVISKSTSDFKNILKECKKFAKKIVILEPQSTTSTTARIRNLTIEGAEELASEVQKITNGFLNKIRNG